MVRNFLFVAFTLISLSVSAIQYPSLEQIATKLYANYSVPEYYGDTIVSYEKKRDGWHVVKSALPKSGDKYLPIANELFWSSTSGKYLLLTMFRKGSTHEFSYRVRRDKYTTGFYDFERCPYYGYDGWYTDIILDFGSSIPANDTLAEALARAYNAMASAYIGMQYGWELKSQLALPEKERLDFYVINAKKSIDLYDVIRKRNPHFGVLIGEVTTKYANEIMAHYEAMSYYKRESEFNQYFNEDLYDPLTRGIAKGLLENCATDGILFTNGDNDTFPLWYMQWIKGVRKDVAVMNMSLMNIDKYLDRHRGTFRGSKAVKFTRSKAAYAACDYYMVSNEEGSNVQPAQFFESITADYKLNPGDTTFLIGSHKIIVANPPGVFDAYELLAPSAQIVIDIRTAYVLQGDFAMLDILLSNYKERGIYFTSVMSAPKWISPFIFQEGMVKRFIPSQLASPSSLLYSSVASARIAGKKMTEFLALDTACTDRTNGATWLMNFKIGTTAIAMVMIEHADTNAAVMLMDKLYSRFPVKRWKPGSIDYYAMQTYYSARKPEQGDSLANALLDVIQSDLNYWNSLPKMSEDQLDDKSRWTMVASLISSEAKNYDRAKVKERADAMVEKLK